jgi:diguanylate cyclase (GGDEF)-like protein
LKKCILVIEDSKAFRTFLEREFRNLDFDVVTATSLEETKEIFEFKTDFFCVVSDYCLPDAPYGEAIDYAINLQQRVIVITGNFDKEIRSSFIEKQILDYILKDSLSSINYVVKLVQRLRNNLNHHALIVDDSPSIRNHIANLLEHQYITTTQAEDGIDGLNNFASNDEITFIIADHNMPIKDGISMIRDIRAKTNGDSVPILGLSGSEDPTLTAQFLKAGANDFINKPFNQEEFYCRVHQTLNLKESADALYKMANQDALTGLWNRRYLFDNYSRCSVHDNVAMMDIDFFKSVNDTYGHDGGDAVLRDVSKVLQHCLSTSVVVRFGGEEFCVFNQGDRDEFYHSLEIARKEVEDLYVIHEENVISVTISMGLSNDGDNLDSKIISADKLLYQSKENGRNQISY